MLQKISDFIAHNVPAVCDVFAARTRLCEDNDQGRKNVGGARRGNEAQRNDLAGGTPGATEGSGGAYGPVIRRKSGARKATLLCRITFRLFTTVWRPE
jgi:hypothetical protein